MVIQKALYFMPDISGFTDFINATELQHSIHIISELLELMLDSNELNFKLVEIEGDALFMYSTSIPTYNQLIYQIDKMFTTFHSYTKQYEEQRICNCGSCKTTINLGLKFLVHYGNLNYIRVKKIKKPYGIDVVEIHRLLKNKINSNNYFLFTESLYKYYNNTICDDFVQDYENYGGYTLRYYYKELQYKSNPIPIFKKMPANFKKTDFPVLTLHRVFESNVLKIFTLLSDLKFRHLWDKDIKRIENITSRINRVGTEHNCILDFGKIKFETFVDPLEKRMNYGEKTQNLIFTSYYFFILILEPLDSHKTKITLNLYIKFSFFGMFFKNIILKMITKSWFKKLENLHQVSKQIINLMD